jgi:hypothetical protein
LPLQPSTPTSRPLRHQRNKLTSTQIQPPIEWSQPGDYDDDRTYIDHSYQMSPPTLSQIEQSRYNCFTTLDDTTIASQDNTISPPGHEMTATLGEFRQVNPSFFHSASDDNDNELYVCCVSYVAKNNVEITLDYADRVKLIYDRGDAMLVQNVITGRCGYAPSVCLVTVQTFLEDLRCLMDEF